MIFKKENQESLFSQEVDLQASYKVKQIQNATTIKVANRVAFKRTNSIDFDGEQSHSNARLDVNNYQTKCMTRNPSNEELQ